MTAAEVVEHRKADVRRLMVARVDQTLANEVEGAKVALSAAAASTVLLVKRWPAQHREHRTHAAHHGVARRDRHALLAVVFGMRTVRRFGMLADNARRLSRGRGTRFVRGSDEMAELDSVYREMFARSVRAKARLEEPARDTASSPREIAAGDLTARVRGRDGDESARLGTNLNPMAASLEQLVDEIRGAAGSLASATARNSRGDQSASLVSDRGGDGSAPDGGDRARGAANGGNRRAEDAPRRGPRPARPSYRRGRPSVGRPERARQ